MASQQEASSSVDAKPPTLASLDDFTMAVPYHRQEKDGKLKFKRTLFTLVDEDNYVAWYGSLKIPKAQITVEQATKYLRRIPDEIIHPAVIPGIPLISTTEYISSEDTLIKRPDLYWYRHVTGTPIIAEEFMDEIEVWQHVQKRRHRNPAEFKGCLEKNGRIVAILLKKYGETLRNRVEDSTRPFDRHAFLEDLEAAAKHLHSMNLAHNGLCPFVNIRMDSEDTPVITDIGSCKPLGEKLHIVNDRHGWNDEYQPVSCIANDESALRKIREWLLSDKSKSSKEVGTQTESV